MTLEKKDLNDKACIESLKRLIDWLIGDFLQAQSTMSDALRA